MAAQSSQASSAAESLFMIFGGYREHSQPYGINRHPHQIQVKGALRDRLNKSFHFDFRGDLVVKGIGKLSTCFLFDLPKDAASGR